MRVTYDGTPGMGVNQLMAVGDYEVMGDSTALSRLGDFSTSGLVLGVAGYFIGKHFGHKWLGLLIGTGASFAIHAPQIAANLKPAPATPAPTSGYWAKWR
jgi:hypothetical protein